MRPTQRKFLMNSYYLRLSRKMERLILFLTEMLAFSLTSVRIEQERSVIASVMMTLASLTVGPEKRYILSASPTMTPLFPIRKWLSIRKKFPIPTESICPPWERLSFVLRKRRNMLMLPSSLMEERKSPLAVKIVFWFPLPRMWQPMI